MDRMKKGSQQNRQKKGRRESNNREESRRGRGEAMPGAE
jgi:hypothetical protein